MKKKLMSLMLVAATSVTMLAGCQSASAPQQEEAQGESATEEQASEGLDASNIKVGVIYIGDENEGYTAAHMQGIDDMQAALGLSDEQVIEKSLIPEDESCADAAEDLVDQGCNVVFATSFGHESFLMQVAGDHPEVEFAHATGYQAAGSGLSNFHNYFDNIYEARYVSGVVAGMKLNEMIADGKITADQAKVGYVGAYPYAEVISGFTSFFLGVRSQVPTATMEVQYTNSWADMTAEGEVATQLIADGCVLISQHADTTGAPTACEKAGVPCVGYNVDMTAVAPTCALTSASNNWGVYYTYAVQAVLNGEVMPADWTAGFADGAVAITDLNQNAIAEGTEDVVKETIEAISSGKLNVFDTSTFTVDGGKTLEDAIAEGGDYAQYAQYVSDGAFHESSVASAPAFAMIIDGITANAE
ncbi:BMP family ABC transporter substrate-binding protein [Butyrivibrio sp. MC2013]|uniref:BMP family ABC transporter substrate-binding protein n=1 Tax=Butyrivibrio sp. MC2013 TaxID=1280686 RepID=UPI000417C376|nr:BMP family ABC transporter substrate-binding protein [Butyrivibrio sp. MC2013]